MAEAVVVLCHSCWNDVKRLFRQITLKLILFVCLVLFFFNFCFTWEVYKDGQFVLWGCDQIQYCHHHFSFIIMHIFNYIMNLDDHLYPVHIRHLYV